GPPPAADDNQVRELFAHAATVDSAIGQAADEQTVRGVKIVADARDNLAQAAPEAASLLSVQSVEVADIFALLSPDESPIDYFSQGDDLYAFVLSGKHIKGLTLSSIGLDDRVRAFRAAIARRDPRTMDIGRDLYDRLLRPLIPDLKGSKLTIAPHGVLHYLP